MINGEDAALKSYKSSSIGTKSVIRLELEVRGHSSLGRILNECANFQAEQKAAIEAEKPRRKKEPQKALPSPLLQLPYHGSDE